VRSLDEPNVTIAKEDRSDVYTCPTRGFRLNKHASGGQAIDYVPVGVTGDPDNPAAFPHSIIGNYSSNTRSNLAWMKDNAKPYMKGVIIPAGGYQVNHNAPGGALVRSQVTLSGIVDGLTYTALVGEKHINPAMLGESTYDNPIFAAQMPEGG